MEPPTQLRAAAIEAAKLILERQGDAIVDAAQKRAASVLSSNATSSGVGALVRWSNARCVADDEVIGGVRAALLSLAEVSGTGAERRKTGTLTRLLRAARGSEIKWLSLVAFAFSTPAPPSVARPRSFSRMPRA